MAFEPTTVVAITLVPTASELSGLHWLKLGLTKEKLQDSKACSTTTRNDAKWTRHIYKGIWSKQSWEISRGFRLSQKWQPEWGMLQRPPHTLQITHGCHQARAQLTLFFLLKIATVRTVGNLPLTTATPGPLAPPQNRRGRPPPFRDRQHSPIALPVNQEPPQIDAVKCRICPAWIREGFEKMGHEKWKLGKEKMEPQRSQLSKRKRNPQKMLKEEVALIHLREANLTVTRKMKTLKTLGLQAVRKPSELLRSHRCTPESHESSCNAAGIVQCAGFPSRLGGLVVKDQETAKRGGGTGAPSHLTLTRRSYGTKYGKIRKRFGEKKKNSSCYMMNRWKKKNNKQKSCNVLKIILECTSARLEGFLLEAGWEKELGGPTPALCPYMAPEKSTSRDLCLPSRSKNPQGTSESGEEPRGTGPWALTPDPGRCARPAGGAAPVVSPAARPLPAASCSLSRGPVHVQRACAPGQQSRVPVSEDGKQNLSSEVLPPNFDVHLHSILLREKGQRREHLVCDDCKHGELGYMSLSADATTASGRKRVLMTVAVWGLVEERDGRPTHFYTIVFVSHVLPLQRNQMK
ncbi:hypothetical protein HPG69_009909 [Diceros bicornis minor]|uniref:Uncharacterized protein n=1 Tax=Diceros bicornis minor TaxID=77932 RepID=A0A7J7EB36_DICBM|nr:hypothetical protein HPG69_009909 [Diceros bicornis minor]